VSAPAKPPPVQDAPAGRPKRAFQFPGAVTVLAIVTVLVWAAALVIPAGQYERDADGAPIAGSYAQVDSPLTFGERVQQLVLSPINGVYGIADPDSGVVDTENVGFLFGSVGVVVFIMSLGAFLSVSFSTRSLEVAVAALARRMQTKGWLLIVVIMALFAVLGSAMGFSEESFGFYALLIPLMTALGYDRMVTASMIILGALVGGMASTVNPFSIGVASGEAGISLGEGIGLRLVLWVLLVGISIAYVLRYAALVRKDPSRSLVARDPDFPADGSPSTTTDEDGAADEAPDPELSGPMTGVQKAVLAITAGTFGLMIFSVIPWSSILGGSTGPADYDLEHETAAEPFAWELGWWFPQLAMLFILAAVITGLVARMGEGRIVQLIGRGMGDMIGPALVIVLARGVAVIMTNTQTLDTVLNAMERAVTGASAGGFAVLVALVNIPLAFLIPSSSGHATLAMPLLAPLSDFAGVSRALTITAYQMGHGFMLLFAPTNVVVVAGLALARVGYDRYLRFVAPLLGILLVVFCTVLFVAASLE
jgi:uncharacterized ion transporter superfamily protein YfcC